MGRKKTNKKKSGALADHKQVGKKFIPPLKQLESLQEIRYDREILPEIIWMGLINDNYGLREGVNIVTSFCELVNDVCGKGEIDILALVGDYSRLSPDSKSQILEETRSKGLLTRLRGALAPLVELYSDFPLSFLGSGEDCVDKSDLISAIQRCVDTHLDKYQTPSLVIQANVAYIQGRVGRLVNCSNIEEPDLESLINNPDSESARKAGAFVCSSVLCMFGTPEGLRDNTWARSFWNQSLRIAPCEFSWELNDQD